MIFRFVLFLLVLFLAIRFIMRFLLPIMKITRMTHQQMNDMKRKMDDIHHNQHQSKQKQVEGDYIEYEEIK